MEWRNIRIAVRQLAVAAAAAVCEILRIVLWAFLPAHNDERSPLLKSMAARYMDFKKDHSSARKLHTRQVSPLEFQLQTKLISLLQALHIQRRHQKGGFRNQPDKGTGAVVLHGDLIEHFFFSSRTQLSKLKVHPIRLCTYKGVHSRRFQLERKEVFGVFA